MVCADRLNFGHIEAGASDPFELERCDQGLLIDHGPTRGVNQYGVTFHQGELMIADHMAGLRG